MKAKIKNIITVVILAGAFTACDLDVVPPSDIAVENFWKTEKDAWYGLNSCYANMDGLFGTNYAPTTHIAINLGKVTLNWYSKMVSARIKGMDHIASA